LRRLALERLANRSYQGSPLPQPHPGAAAGVTAPAGRARAADVMMRWVLIAPLMLLLVGCLDDQKQAEAKCELETFRMYPNQRTQYTVDAEGFLRLCMRAAGYDFDASSSKCGLKATGTFVSSDDPYCYVPSGRIARFIYKLEMALE
jgi:hypothetical protein